MKKRIYIKNEKPGAPWWFTMAVILFIDRLGYPGWAWGAGGVLMAMAWIVYFNRFFNSVEIDIFEDLRDPIKMSVTRNFQEMVNERIREAKQKADASK